MGLMTTVTERQLSETLGSLPQAQPRVVISGNFATPSRTLELLDRAVESYRLFTLNAQPPMPQRADVIHESPFVGAGVRHLSTLEYLPMRLSMVPKLFAVARPPDIVVLHTSVPRGDKVSMGIEVNVLPAAVASVKHRGGLVIAQVNPQMPYTYGDGELALDDIDLLVEIEEPLAHPVTSAPRPECAEIGRHVARLVPDGATLQLGIGHIPDAVLHQLLGRTGLRIWTEVFSDGVLELHRQAALEASQPVVASFLFGSAELYQWADGNPTVRMYRTETVNNPARIARHPAMTSINTALQVDLYDQANASYVRERIYSGLGGQPDFVVGAIHARRGRSIIGLPSWHRASASSCILPALSTPSTSIQHSAIVTEQGCAELFGCSQKAQARLLIEEAAHPDARDLLWKAADQLGLVSSTD